MLTPYNIIYPLTALINKIIHTSIPSHAYIWKDVIVTPLPKPGDPSNPSNYRPISSLPILSKVAETAIAHQIHEHLEANTLISPNQCGFRRNHSTQSLLRQLTKKWLKIMDNTIGDRFNSPRYEKKAFDYVDHTLLLYKTINYFNLHPTSTNDKLLDTTSSTSKNKWHNFHHNENSLWSPTRLHYRSLNVYHVH